jgi:hypothetical protein
VLISLGVAGRLEKSHFDERSNRNRLKMEEDAGTVGVQASG